MSHIDSSTLAGYNSLTDPNLQSYFSSERIRSHLKHAGLVSGGGEVLSEGEYRTRLARREHQKHVRHMLAENIVNRAIDMERTRNAQMKRHFEMIAKAAVVNDIKESRRRGGNSSSCDLALLAMDSSWAQTRPRSANYQNEMYDEQTRISRVQSANVVGEQRTKYSSKTSNRRSRSLKPPKSSQRRRSPTKYPDLSSSPPCQITMVYYGPHTKVDYDHLVFSEIDEIIVMQQHCGGENLIVHKNYLKPGAEFTFNSRRHSDYPFGLSLYVKGLIDSRISTCCEYKHRHGVRLGGDRGHFAIKSVEGSKPCVKCRFEKQARLKKYAESPKGKKDESKKAITILVPVSDEPKMKQTSVQIPVRHTSVSNDSYSEDFDGSEKRKPSARDGYSTDSSGRPSHPREQKLKSSGSTPKVPPRASRIARKESSARSDSTLDATPKNDSTKKTWQIIFHTSNIPTGNFPIGKNHSSKGLLLKFSFIATDEEDETETHEINMKPFIENSNSARQHSFPIKLKNIGKPDQIRLKIHTKANDDDDDREEEDIKWHLDHIELIDPETQSHLIFPCKKWIRLQKEKYLQLSEEFPRDERKRKDSTSTNSSRSSPTNHKTRQQSSKLEQKAKTSSRSSTPSNSPKQLRTKFTSSHRISSDHQSTDGSRQQSPKLEQKAKTTSDSPKPAQTKHDSSRRTSSDRQSNDGSRQQSPKLERKAKTTSDSPKPTQTKHDSSRRTSSDRQSNDGSRQQSPKLEQKAKTSSDSPKPPQTQHDPSRRISSDHQSTDGSRQQSPKLEQKAKTSSDSPKPPQSEHDSSRRISSDRKSNGTPHSDTNDQENKIHYRVTIYPSNDEDGEFNPTLNSRIFVRLNNHPNEIQLTKKSDQLCPTFESGVKQIFELDFIQDNDEQPTKLTIGYVNSQITARKWKLEKIVLYNTQTDHETIFPCKESLYRNESNFRAEQTFEVQLEESDDESTSRNPKITSPKPAHEEEIQSPKTPQTNDNNKQRSPSFRSMGDNDADYKKIFKQLDPKNELNLGSPPRSPPPRPKTRHGRQEHTNPPVEPLNGLDDLADQTARSNDQQNPSSLPSTTTDNTKDQFKRWYPTNADDDEEDN